MGKAENPTVSVIIPTYNRAHLVGRAIRSVLNQTYQDFELIVVDDGSTDNTEEVVKGFNDDRIRYICHDENKGGSAARNTGIKIALGEYIAFLDSDDEWLPEKLRRQIGTLQKLSKEWAGVCTGFWLIDGGSVIKYTPPLPRNLFTELLSRCFLYSGSTLLIRKVLLDEIGGFDEALPRHQDWDLLLRISKTHKLAVIREPLVRIYASEHPPANKVREAKERLLAKYAQDLQSMGAFRRRQIMGSHWLELACLYAGEKHFAQSILYLRKAILQNPIQRPGRYIRLVDAMLGTRITRTLSAFKQQLIHHMGL